MKRFTGVILVLLFALQAIAQDNRERAYVHLNSQVLVAGETLLLSAYCRSHLTGKPSNLSKVLYVEIIGSSGLIYQEKLKLDGGRGSSEFFISSTVPTGKYYLVAYTRWMKNFDEYFKSPIEIINPFEPIPAAIQKSDKLEVQFFIDNNKPVAGITNSIGFRIKSGAKNIHHLKGKIVSSTGETLTSVEYDNYGIGSFEFKPILGESYNMILEDELGKIQFFEIPNAAETGITLQQLSRNVNLLALRLQSLGIKESSGILNLYNENNKVADQLVDLNSNTSIDLRNINGELFRVEVMDAEDNILISRMFYKPSRLTSTININAESSYPTRSAVNLGLTLEDGTYSISVRKKAKYLSETHTQSIASSLIAAIKDSPIDISDYISSPDESNFDAFLLGSTLNAQKLTPNLRLLPEFRNEFLDGTLLTHNKSPIANEIVALTIFSDPFTIQTSKTDSLGNFSIPFESLARDTEGVVTPVRLDSTYKVELISPFMANLENLNYELPPLDSSQVQEVVAKTIRNQIENAYYKADTNPLSLSQNPAQIDFNKSYTLDEYTRFNSLKETFVEYIPEVSVRERRVSELEPHFKSVPDKLKQPPLLLLDGVPVSADKILDFSASNIERISILNNRYFLGPLISDGIVHFKTFEGKMGRFTPSSYHHFTTILGLIEARPFKSPIYSGAIRSKLPDQRDQLYWNPEYKVSNNDTNTISFYTSDVLGDFEIVVEGFTSDGLPVSKIMEFEVVESTEK